jgi:Fe-S oxidoreductase
VLAAARAFLERDIAIVGLEPSCLLTLRDEFVSLLPGADTERLAGRALLFEEFLAREVEAGRIRGPIGGLSGKLLLHGHCHQKAFGALAAVQQSLALVSGLAVETVDSSCCGMAGAFGYAAETHAVSLAMGELSLLPKVRNAAPQTLIAADGFSCRHQIRDGTGRSALHVARVLREAIAAQP